MVNKILNGDSLEVMKKINDSSIDLILCDLPYGTTNCKWDIKIPAEQLWQQYLCITKPNAAILLFAQQPFATELIVAGRKYFRYEIVWEKSRATGFLNAKKMPLRAHELVLVFYKKLPTYNPQFSAGKPYKSKATDKSTSIYTCRKKIANVNTGYRYPRDVVRFNISAEDKYYHPTQKPLALLRYLIQTYSNENDIVLDNCCGSGSTCVAAKQTNRRYIGIELNENYFEIANKRIEEI